MAERGGFFKTKIKEAVEWVTEKGKRLDFVLIGSGIVVYLFHPGVGAAIILGSAITLIPQEMLQRWAKKK